MPVCRLLVGNNSHAIINHNPASITLHGSHCVSDAGVHRPGLVRAGVPRAPHVLGRRGRHQAHPQGTSPLQTNQFIDHIFQGNRSEAELLALHREMEIMRSLAHPNIITLVDAFDVDNHVRAPRNRSLLVTEADCGGDGVCGGRAVPDPRGRQDAAAGAGDMAGSHNSVTCGRSVGLQCSWCRR